ncbi:DUF4097 domain-containing protein [Neobacillus mesonae]|uniref:LiaG family protein n=1 Tax=Neobacillus mesonae TaxID=1193713 RepID=UPI002572DA83|nr:DUF4097 domain-containing protein [Neobacillus mesonae]MED4205581.1 DUF4097 domain-containing protein [Neobacillus mesonae]
MKRIFILLLVITGVYIIFHQSFQFNWFGAGITDGQAAISKNIKVIKVDAGSVSTEIIPEDRPDLKTVYNGKQRLTVTEKGNMVVVTLKKKWFNGFNFLSFSEKNKLKIYLPKDYDRSMVIDIGSGSLSFSGASKNTPMKLEELSIDIGSGNIHLKNLDVKNFTHEGSSGNVSIDTLTTKTGSFDFSSGNLNIKHYKGALEADLSSGRLKVQLDELTDFVKIDVSSGMVDLDLPDDADFTLNGEADSGFITNDFPLTSNGGSKKQVHGTHGTGKHKIDLDVSSGIIRIF